MDGFTIAAASGMRARLESLDLLANNLANQASPGYKADREFYSLYVSQEAIEASDGTIVEAPTTAPLIEKTWTDYSQGVLTETGNPLHVAISGNGFFQVKGPNTLLYTRNGNFRVSATGGLETQEGYAVMGRDNQPIRINASRPVEINGSGEIRQDGAVVGQFGFYDIVQPQALTKQAGTYFRLSDPNLANGAAATGTIYQGRLETANHTPAEAAVRLITVMRQFESLQKAVQIGGEMSRKADELGRVSN